MPTYDYVCEACGHEFEHFQSMSDRHLRTCPKCGKKKLIRKVGAGAGLIFKGSGFYQTDYKKSSVPPPSESKSDDKPSGKSSDKSSDKPSEKSSDKPSEKPAARPERKPTSKPDKKDST